MAPILVEDALVLSGGKLRGKMMISTMSVEGRRYTSISKASTLMCQFLAGRRAKISPLKDSSVLQKLVKLRNAASRLNLSEVKTDSDEVGLDLHRPAPKLPKRPRYLKSQHKDIVNITVEGSPMAVLRGKGHEVVYVEVTTENMALLYRMFSNAAQASERVHDSEMDMSEMDMSEPNTPASKEELDQDLPQCTPTKHKVLTKKDSSPRGTKYMKRQ